MSTAGSLLSLMEKAPRDEQGNFKDTPERKALLDALAATKPLGVPELLKLAIAMRSDPKRAHRADHIAFQALSLIAHDRDCRVILSKIGNEITPWGLSVNQLFAQVMRAYRAPDTTGPTVEGDSAGGEAGAGTRYTIGTSGSGGPSVGQVLDTCTYEGFTVPEGKTMYFPPTPEEASYLGATKVAAQCLNGKLILTPE